MTDLGYQPLRGKLLLSDGADWVVTLTTGEVWPDGTEVWCQVGDLDPWDATVTESTGTAAFKVESEVTDTVESGTEYTIFIKYPTTPTTEYAWFEDTVKRTRR